MTDIIQEGIDSNLISLSEEGKLITYCNHHKPRNFNNPEEKVQAVAFITLVLRYGYDPNKIKHYETVTMGGEKKEADIIVYNDAECTQPHILVECKKTGSQKNKSSFKLLSRLIAMLMPYPMRLNMYGLHQVSKTNILK